MTPERIAERNALASIIRDIQTEARDANLSGRVDALQMADTLLDAGYRLASEPTQTDRETARAIAESEHYTDADSLTEAIAAALASARAAARAEALEELAVWIETQRNDIPATGKEFAAAIRALKGAA